MHRFVIDSRPNLTAVNDLNFPNVLPSSPLEGINLNTNGELLCGLMAIFQGRLYVCTEADDQCHSWDLATGTKYSHPSLNNEPFYSCYFSSAQVNGKLWVNGGYFDMNTYFLMPDFTWVEGPWAPFYNYFHVSVAIDDTRVVIFGGYSDEVWLYDDYTHNFYYKNPFYIGMDIVACKFMAYPGSEIPNDVVLVRDYIGNMFIYEWNYDIWTQLDQSWTKQTGFYSNHNLLQIEQRYGSTSIVTPHHKNF